MVRRPPRLTQSRSSAASDVYKRQGVGYRYRDNDGLHITLADGEGVDAVQIRQGAKVKLYANSEAYDGPGDAPPVWAFEGKARNSRALLPQRVRADRFSFFELEDGHIAHVSFLRTSDRELSLIHI